MKAAGREDAALRRARRLLARHPLIDGHNDLAWVIRNAPKAPGDVEAYDLRRRTPGDTDLARLREGRVGGQFWSVYVPGDAKAEGFARLQLEPEAFGHAEVMRQSMGHVGVDGTFSPDDLVDSSWRNV